MSRLVFGSIDFQLDMGITGDEEELLLFPSGLVRASRFAGLAKPVDGVCTLDLPPAGQPLPGAGVHRPAAALQAGTAGASGCQRAHHHASAGREDPRRWVWVTEAKPLRCAINPTVGQELIPFPTAQRRKKVVVIGGGAGGLEATRASAEAGHEVVSFERGTALGGKLVWAKGHQAYNESSIAMKFLINKVHQLRVDVRLRTEPTVQGVQDEKPDAVIVATGATPMVPEDSSLTAA